MNFVIVHLLDVGNPPGPHELLWQDESFSSVILFS